MNNLDMLELIGNVRDSYIKEAQNHRSPRKTPVPKRRAPWKIILIAAVMALLLTGCAYAVMKLQDKKVADTSYTKRRDVYGNLVEPTDMTVDVIYPYAPVDSPMMQAAKEWYEFTESFDPNRELLVDQPEGIPENYLYIYDCYTQHMVDKLDEIAAKYGLKLLEVNMVAQSYQKDILHEALGIRSVVRSDAKAEVKEHYGDLCPDGTFSSSVFFTLEGEDAWEKQAFADFYYVTEGYFLPYYYGYSEEYTQWTYKTADGTTALMAMRPDGQGTVFADVPGGSIMVRLDPGQLSGTPYPRSEDDLPTREDLEQMADIFDYHIKPQSFDLATVKAKLDAREAEVQERMRQKPQYVGFEEYLDKLNHLENWSYMMYDLNGDGTEEMILHGTTTTFVLQFEGDTFTELYMSLTLDYPCEDGYMMCYSPANSDWGESEYYQYQKIRRTPDENTGDWFELKDWLIKKDSGWKYYEGKNDNTGKELTDEEAQAVRNKYPLLDIPSIPLLELPMNGTTLGQVIEARGEPNAEEFRQICADFVTNEEHWMHTFIRDLTYYDIRDITGDGSPELLLGSATNELNYIGTLDRWRIINLCSMATLQLRENHVVEKISLGTYTPREDSPGVPGGEQTAHEFYRFYPDGTRKDLGAYVYLKDTGSWINYEDERISDTAYQEVVDQYPAVEVHLKPLKELIGN